MRFVQVNVPIPSFVDDGNRLETKSKNDILGIKRYQKYILFLFPLFPVFIGFHMHSQKNNGRFLFLPLFLFFTSFSPIRNTRKFSRK